MWSHIEYPRLKAKLERLASDELQANIVRLFVLYEDLRIEILAATRSRLLSLDKLSKDYRRIYFVRRSSVTACEFGDALGRIDKDSAFRRIKKRYNSKSKSTWKETIDLYSNHLIKLKAFRNDLGGHFGRDAGKRAMQNLDPDLNAKWEIKENPLNDKAKVYFHFAGDIVAGCVRGLARRQSVRGYYESLLDTLVEAYALAARCTEGVAQVLLLDGN